MATMTINRVKAKTTGLPIKRAKPGDIRLLVDVNSKANMRVKLTRPKARLCDVFRNIQIGESVFLEGYTSNYVDPDTRLKYLRTQGYSKNNSIVWTVRSTEENGIKGVRVYREG
jgi:hypothetical protein